MTVYICLQNRVLINSHGDLVTCHQPRVCGSGDSLDIQHLLGVGGNSTAIVPSFEDRRGREHHKSLPLCPWLLSGPLSAELGLPLLRGGPLRFHSNCRWSGANGALL